VPNFQIISLLSETKSEESKYMFLSRHQNAGQNRDLKIRNRSFENVSKSKYLGTRVTNQNFIQEKINRGLFSGNACYHSVQNLLSSRLLSKNVISKNIKDYNFPCDSV
jgi:hypothetical protein